MSMAQAVRPLPPEAPVALHLSRPCRCGHPKDAHEHYRRGTDCSGCSCARFHGRIVVTVSLRMSLGKHAPSVVVPDEVPQLVEPYVRPTHAAGLPVERPGRTAVPAAPLPRRPEEPGRVRTSQRG